MIVRLTAAAALVLAQAAAAFAAPVPHVRGTFAVELNPQPEPPGIARSARYTRTSVRLRRRVMLSPQPEPPGRMRETVDLRSAFPPGPCRDILVTVAAPGARPATTHAVAAPEANHCTFDAAVPGARVGSRANVTLRRV